MNLPEGWPTEEMVEAVEKIEPNHHSRGAYLRDILITAIDAAPTPPAQEDEPVCQMSYDGIKWIDVPEESFKTWNPGGSNPLRRKLYTHSSDDKLRKAAEEILPFIAKFWPTVLETRLLDNLRAALERKS